MRNIIEDIDLKDQISVFTTGDNQNRNDYFLNSAWKISGFYEEDALDSEGNLLVEKHEAFNKVGHA